MKIEKKCGSIVGAENKMIHWDATFPLNQSKAIVLFVHGFKGFKDWGSWNTIAHLFAEEGYAFYKFNFSHNGGTKDQLIDFPDLEAFSKNTFSKEVSDLTEMVDFVKRQHPISEIGLIGHSRGGGIALINQNLSPKVDAICTWASVADFGERFPKEKALNQWKKDGEMLVYNGRTKQQMPIRYDWYLDYQNHKENFSILSAIEKLRIPICAIHGENDTTVSAEALLRFSAKRTGIKTVLIKDASHTFNTKHPEDSSLSDAAKCLVKSTIQFFESIF